MLALSGPFENTMTTLRRVVTGHRFPQPEDGLAAIVIQRRNPREIAAEGVDRDRVGAIEASHKVRAGQQGPRGPVLHYLQWRFVALAEGVDLLRNAILVR